MFQISALLLITNLPLLVHGILVQSRKKWVRNSIFIICLFGVTDVMIGQIFSDGIQKQQWLTFFALLDQLLSLLPEIRRKFPGGDFFSPVAVISLTTIYFLGDDDLRLAAGLKIGCVDGWPLAWSVFCTFLSSVALFSWSVWVKGEHGPIQDSLGEILTYRNFVPLAALNAVCEEMEHRMLLMGGLMSTQDETWIWTTLVVLMQAAHFAALHVKGGFPSGISGGLLVFIWGVFLGILRLWSSGIGLVLGIHFQADLVIFVLLLAEKRRKKKI